MRTDKISEFIELVGQQIRWKKARLFVIDEIQNHIIDQKIAFVEDGLDEDKAIEKAIKEMGDPVVVGEQFNRVHKPKPDWALLLLISGILFIGIIIQLFLNPAYTPFSNEWVEILLQRQLLGIIVGIVAMGTAYFFDFTIIGKYPKIIFFILSSICVYYIFKGNQVNGAIKDTIYPLLLFPTAFAGLVYSMRNKGYRGIFICEVCFLIPAFIAKVSPTMTTLLLLYISCLIILTSTVLKGWFQVRKLFGLLTIYIPTFFAFIGMVYFLLFASWRKARVDVFFKGYYKGADWLTTHVRIYLSHSKLIGMGSNTGQEANITANNTDFMLTYIIYNFGWIVFAGIILLFTALIIRAIILSRKQKSILGYLTSQAVIVTFTLQCIIYISVNLGFTLISPLSLPLLSFGGKYLVVNMFLFGILLSVFRTGEYVRDKKVVQGAPLPFIQYDKGTIHINLKDRKTE